MRGDIHRLPAPRGTRGHEQRGARYAVIVQADELMLSTVLIAPTSRSAMPRAYRPTIVLADETTQVLVDQTTAVTDERLGKFIGHVRYDELREIDAALRLVLQLD